MQSCRWPRRHSLRLRWSTGGRGATSLWTPPPHTLLGTRKRRKRRLPRTSSLRGTRLQRAHAKVSGFHCGTSSCSGVCGKHVLRGLATALEATPVFVFVFADYWNDHTGGVTVDFVPSSLVIQYVLRSSMWRQFGCHRGGQCRQGSRPFGSCLTFSTTQAVFVSLLVLTAGGVAWISLGDLVPTSHVKQYVLRSSWCCMRWFVLSRVRVIAEHSVLVDTG